MFSKWPMGRCSRAGRLAGLLRKLLLAFETETALRRPPPPLPPRSPRAQPVSKNRLEAFSDGVFAIAITLLIIEVGVPHVQHGELTQALLREWPKYASYVVSFLVIGIICNHHAIFEHIARVDRALLFLNLLLLLVVAFIPFPTAVLGDYVRDSGPDARAAALLYSATMTTMGIAFTMPWSHASRGRRLLDERLTDHEVTRLHRANLIGVLVYAFTAVVALIAPPLTLLIYAAIALFFARGRAASHV